MKKKGRNIENLEVIDLRETTSTIYEQISIKTDSTIKNEVAVTQFHISPKYGIGFISEFNTKEINIAISKYKLHDDIVYIQASKQNILQVNFLLSGEKIIGLDNNKELVLENRDSYMANIQSFNGKIRILGGSMFNEIKIRLPISFLVDNGFIKDFELKKMSDENLVLPITEELFLILEDLDRKDMTGVASEIYIKAKVFELIAILVESYKDTENQERSKTSNKILKKLYHVKQTIKANLHKNFSLEELAIETGINRTTLNLEFKRVFGCSVKKYSTAHKMDYAMHMLENSEKMVYEIAEEVGYKNGTHFTAAFKRRHGITPKQFRKE